MAKNNLLKGKSADVINANIQMLKNAGYSQARATRCAMCHANKKHSSHAKSIAKKVAKRESGMKIKVRGGLYA
jgi:cytochrome c553